MTVMPDVLPDDPPAERAWLRPLQLAAAGLVAMFAAGGALGAGTAAWERGFTAPRIAIVAAFALVAVASAVWFGIVLRRRAAAGPEAPRVATARRLTMLSGAIGGVLGALIAIGALAGGGEPSDALDLFSNGPVPAPVAVAAIAGLALVLPLSWLWHRSIDEHEAAAYRFGALIGIYVYFFLASIWWMAARGGFAPAPDGVVIFMVTIAAWGLGWAWARFR